MEVNVSEFAVIGAGPAGAHAATRLASAGRQVVLFDPRGAWEKPCGGGVPTRALREFEFILESDNYPRKLIHRITLISPLGRRVSLKLKRPFAVYSREVLNGLVLDRAKAAGARFVRAAVTEFVREGDNWNVVTEDGLCWKVRFLVGADGAASSVRRRLLGIFPKNDLALAFGYNITVAEAGDERIADEVLVRFPKNFTGYLWAFPRPGVMNFGVASKLGEKRSDELRSLLMEFVRECYDGVLPDSTRMNFFGAKIPTLEFGSWKQLRTVGDRWALIGDAAGFADPITGEGIYYAFKSADLLADALITSEADSITSIEPNGAQHGAGYERAIAEYERMWRREFGRDLEHASYRLPQFYHGYFFGYIFIDAMVRLARWHRGVRNVLMRALVGEQSYVTLKRDLLRRAYQIF
jgi:geranylgeranyl reductase family protein